ncbi:MAG: replicative DNA helicase, partial [Taibaiella sp.]|nr:replicative DNA helicase [Taibaiella sp.]
MAVNIKKEFGNTRNRKPDISTLVYGKIPPQAPELEEAILGAIMLEKDKLAEVLEIIQSPDCFYGPANQKIYASIRRLFDKGMPVDLLTVTEELRKSSELELVGGPYYLTNLTMNVVSSAHVESHARIVMEKFIQRELIRISGEIIGNAYEDSTDVFDLLDKAESNLYEITDNHLRKNFTSLKDVLVRTVQEIEEAKNKKDDLTGVPTGFTDLVNLTSGWQKTDLIILAARPAVGKTAFCLNLTMNAAMHAGEPFPVAFFSLEMGAGQLVKRMLAAVTEVSMDAITKGRMQEHEFVQMTQRMNKLATAPIFLDDQAALNIFELRAKARRLKQKHDIKLIVIDYLQLMQGSIEKGGNREQEISKISRDLKQLAKELEVPIIALSQLNRSVESRKDSKVPQLSDLRESGAIEQDADMVMFLYRPEYYGINNDEMGQPIEGETHIHVAKHRNGSTDTVKVRFIKEYQKFTDMPNDNFGGF